MMSKWTTQYITSTKKHRWTITLDEGQFSIQRLNIHTFKRLWLGKVNTLEAAKKVVQNDFVFAGKELPLICDESEATK